MTKYRGYYRADRSVVAAQPEMITTSAAASLLAISVERVVRLLDAKKLDSKFVRRDPISDERVFAVTRDSVLRMWDHMYEGSEAPIRSEALPDEAES